MQVTFNTLKHISETKQHKVLEKVCYIKKVYQNSVIYQKTIKNPLHLGWSRTKLNTFIKSCIENEWGYFFKGNFHLYSTAKINALYQKSKRKVKIQTREDIYFQLLKNRLRQKEFDDKKKTDFNYSTNSRKVKSAIKYFKKSGRSFHEGEQKFKINEGISLEAISATFGVSVSTTHGILKRMAKNGLILIRRRWKNYGRHDNQSFLALSSLYKGIFRNKYRVIMKLDTSIISLIDSEKTVRRTLVCN